MVRRNAEEAQQISVVQEVGGSPGRVLEGTDSGLVEDHRAGVDS